jgi:hypothetical protein
MISVQIDIHRDQIEDAILDTSTREIVSIITSIVERSGDPEFALTLIGKLEHAYIYLQETFGE